MYRTIKSSLLNLFFSLLNIFTYLLHIHKSRKIKVIAIVGPTASGKTDLSIKIAQKIDGEIISADSRQMYTELTHGSGKILDSEKENIMHYGLDCFSIFDGQKSISDWLFVAREAILKIKDKKKIPVVVGGTMHFIDALLYDKEFSNVPPDTELRIELENKNCDELFAILKDLDNDYAKEIDKHNKVRLIRAIEIAKSIGHIPPITQNKNKYKVTWIGLLPSADILRSRIDARLEKRWQNILLEVKNLLKEKEVLLKLGLEYRYATMFLLDQIEEEKAKQEIKLKSWQYAKRQMTWWRKNKNIKWFTDPEKAQKYILDIDLK